MMPLVAIPCRTAAAIDPARAHSVDGAHVQGVPALDALSELDIPSVVPKIAASRSLHGDGVAAESAWQ